MLMTNSDKFMTKIRPAFAALCLAGCGVPAGSRKDGRDRSGNSGPAPQVQPPTSPVATAQLALAGCVIEATHDPDAPKREPSGLEGLMLDAFTSERDPLWVQPMQLDDLRFWISLRYHLPTAALSGHDPERSLTWRLKSKSAQGLYFTSVYVHWDGDCPVTARRAMWHNSDGLLVRDRAVLENCEYVDAAIQETRLERDGLGRVRQATVTSSPHPIHAYPERDEQLDDQLEIPDVEFEQRVEEQCNADYDTLTVRCEGRGDPLEAACGDKREAH